MDPPPLRGRHARFPAPRARGDGPFEAVDLTGCEACSPRTRGWTRDRACVQGDRRLLPAHAGMDPRRRWPWTRSGTTCCSPRTRGWTPNPPGALATPPLLPAHAGMDPRDERGVPVRVAASRARGDGPTSGLVTLWPSSCSPRTRGWTLVGRAPLQPAVLLPAHAGMDPRSRICSTRWVTAPRARGDGPVDPDPANGSTTCSPRTRGWTLVHHRGAVKAALLPAHAGMDPTRESPLTG